MSVNVGEQAECCISVVEAFTCMQGAPQRLVLQEVIQKQGCMQVQLLVIFKEANEDEINAAQGMN